MPKYATINTTTETKVTILKLADKFNISQVQLLNEMAIYFEKTGVNPSDLLILSPADELKKFRDTIISFLRKQEKDFIMPVFSRIDTVAMLLTKHLQKEDTNNSNSLNLSVNKQTNTINSTLQNSNNTGIINEVDNSEKNKVDNSENFTKLKSEYDILELKYNTICKYYKNILSNTENKSTGLNKMPVINLPLAEVNSYKDYLKRL